MCRNNKALDSGLADCTRPEMHWNRKYVHVAMNVMEESGYFDIGVGILAIAILFLIKKYLTVTVNPNGYILEGDTRDRTDSHFRIIPLPIFPPRNAGSVGKCVVLPMRHG